jgi:FtsZ-binding cell division protein ZapB
MTLLQKEAKELLEKLDIFSIDLQRLPPEHADESWCFSIDEHNSLCSRLETLTIYTQDVLRAYQEEIEELVSTNHALLEEMSGLEDDMRSLQDSLSWLRMGYSDE